MEVITNILAQYIVLNEINWKIICVEHFFELTHYLATVCLILHSYQRQLNKEIYKLLHGTLVHFD